MKALRKTLAVIMSAAIIAGTGAVSFSAAEVSDRPTGDISSDTVAVVDFNREFKEYASFSEAVNEWTGCDGATLYLYSDVETEEKITVTKTNYIQLNGYGIMYTGAEQSSVFYNLGKLTVYDTGVKRVHYITLTDGRGTAVSDEGVESDSCIKVSGGYITGGTGSVGGVYGGGILSYGDDNVENDPNSEDGVKLYICGGTICGNTADMGAGILVENSSLYLLSGTVSDNTARGESGFGGGICVLESAYASIEGGTVRDNSALYGGGVMSFGTLGIGDGEFTGNTATEAGAGIFCYDVNTAFYLGGNLVFKDNKLGNIEDDILLSNSVIQFTTSLNLENPVAVNGLDYTVFTSSSPDVFANNYIDEFYTTYEGFGIENYGIELAFVRTVPEEPTTEAAQPTSEVPATEATVPTTETTVPATEATEPMTELPSTEATMPTTEATEPTTEVPTTEATVPTTEVTQPATEEPTTQAAEATAKPSEQIAVTPSPLAKTKVTTVIDDKKRKLYIFCDEVKGAESCVVNYRKAGAKKWTSKYTDDTFSLTVSGVEKNKCYEIKVRAVGRKDGVTVSGKWSDTYRVFIAGMNVGKVKRLKKTATLKWKKNTKASGYQVYYSTKASMKGKKLLTVKGKKKTGCKLKGLKAGKKYYVELRAYKTVKGKKFFGEYTVVTIKK